jgi:autotransporter-associated beta strand protein
MKITLTNSNSSAFVRLIYTAFTAVFLPALLLMLSIQPTHAASATWKTSPPTNDWHTANNWSPQTVPDGFSDTATFGTSSITAISIADTSDSLTELAGITFNPGASAYTLTLAQGNALYFEGAGVINNSGVTQTIALAPYAGLLSYLQFFNSATAGTSTDYEIGFDQYTYFYNTSTAGDATFDFNGATSTYFSDSSSAGNATFNLNGAESFFDVVFFQTGATAANATFNINGTGNGNQCQFFTGSSAGAALFTLDGAVDINHGPGQVLFYGGDAGSATFVAKAGLNRGFGSSIFFQNDSTGGTSRIEVFGDGLGDFTNGHLNISQHLAPGVTIGSLEGSGFVELGANKLTVGANNLTTAFSGLIKDGGSGGSLAKMGRGRFTLNKVNTYTGGTTVTQGTLLVGNPTGSCTGTGPVAVNAGTLGGTGKISGAVTIGTATTAAILAPGSRAELGRLTLSNTLTFNARGNYQADLNSTLVRTDQVAANGVTINSGATATITDLGNGTLATGTVFTIINNTANTPIPGTFSNLADGSTLVIGSNTYLVSYEGGTGNDLTLTVQ